MIEILARVSDKLTQCQDCTLGHSEAGSSKCEMCDVNTYYGWNEEAHFYDCI